MEQQIDGQVAEDELSGGDRISATGIDWDADGDEDALADLPDEVTLTLPADWEPGDSIADLLSDRHGFCVNGIGALWRA